MSTTHGATIGARAMARFGAAHPHALSSAPVDLFSVAWAQGKPDPRFQVQSSHRGATAAPGYASSVVIAHGLMGTTNNFHTPGNQLSRALADVLEGVTAVDMRNHGRSPHHEIHSSVALAIDLINHVSRVVDAAPFSDRDPQIVLMGHSMGGTAVATALCIASDPAIWDVIARSATQMSSAEKKALESTLARFDQIVKGAVIVDVCPYPRMPSAFDRIENDLEALVELPLSHDLSPKEVGEALKEKIPNDMMRNFLLTNLITARDTSLGPKRTTWRCNLPVLRRCLPNLAFPFEDEFDAEQKVKIPTMFVFGDRSAYNMEAGRKAIPKFFANNRSEAVIENSDHYPHYEQRDAFCAAVEPFIRECLE